MTTSSIPRTFPIDEVAVETIPMTYAEYTAWLDKEVGRRGEWVDGEVIAFVSATFLHENLVSFLNAILRFVLDVRGLGVVVGSNYELRTREGAARQADLTVVLNEHRDRITDRRLVGAADLVVEVISPDSVSRDRHDKLHEYAEAGIPEYWVLDPREGRESVEVFLLGGNGRYAPVGPDRDGLLRSSVIPGVWLDPRWLIGGELPSVAPLAIKMAESVEPLA